MVVSTQASCLVLLAVYNGMSYLDEQLKSIFNQINVNITVMISVDVSTDGSYQWLKNLARSNPALIILPYGQQFGGAGRNFFHLLRKAAVKEFDVVAFADQDDYWYHDKIFNAIAQLNQGFDGYSSNVTAFWANNKKVTVNKAQPQRHWDFLFEAAGPGCTYVMNQRLATAIQQCIIKQWSTIQSVSLHDWFCYAFARAHHFQWYIDPKPTMLYRQHEANQVGVNRGLKAAITRYQRVKQGWWFNQVLLIADVIGVGGSTFVKSWSGLSRGELLTLACCAPKCRRRRFDQSLFFMICIFLAVMGCKDFKKTND